MVPEISVTKILLMIWPDSAGGKVTLSCCSLAGMLTKNALDDSTLPFPRVNDNKTPLAALGTKYVINTFTCWSEFGKSAMDIDSSELHT